MQFIRGQKTKIQDLIKGSQLTLSTTIKMQSNTVVDAVCFGVDSNERIADDRYFIFYNQMNSPEGSIQKVASVGNEDSRFVIDFAKLPSHIKKMIVAVSIDGNEVMKDMVEGHLSLFEGQQALGDFSFTGAEYQGEKALILAEIYEKDQVWRVNFVGRGFNGGLSVLLKHYGGEENEVTPATTQVAPSPQVSNASATSSSQGTKVSLTKAEKVQKVVLEKAPHLVDLTKKATVTLEKKGLLDVTAKVAVVLDASGSMYFQYDRGDVQKVIDRVLPLALMFDDDKELEIWAFADKCKKLTNITVDSIKGYINREGGGWTRWNIGSCNDEPRVMKEVIKEFKASQIPAYVIFISDGGVCANSEIEKLIVEAAAYPIFWQFVGIGGSDYGILERLDDLQSRIVDNVDFFSLDKIDSISDEELYQKLLTEFPSWLNQVRQKGII